MDVKHKALFLIVCALGWALCVQTGFSNSTRGRLAPVPGSDMPSLNGSPAAPEAEGYRIEKFSIGFDPPGAETVRLLLEYNNRNVWEGTVEVPGEVELEIKPDTDFQEEPKPGYSRDDRIYLFLRSDNYASQWHTLKREGRTLKFTDSQSLEMHRKKYAVIDYALFQGDDPNFEGRTPTYSGIAAVGHWGSLPGFIHDWQIWQGSPYGDLWGDTLRLEFHRGTPENGMIESTEEYEKMFKAPESGYIHYGGCSEPSRAAEAGKSYYCRIVGHTESTRGYGKIRIQEITVTPPKGMDVLED